jgi:endonuclease YncB( thermonuclease family)
MAAAGASSDTGAAVEARRPLVTLCALALLATASVAAAQSQWAPTSAQVTRAIDGEAIEVKIGDRAEIVRYIGISTPEIQLPTRGGQSRQRPTGDRQECSARLRHPAS